MTMIVEDGSGIYEANSYAGLSYAHAYLHRRNRHVPWDAATPAAREAALVSATDYIDRRFGSMFLGAKKFTDIEIAASNYLQFNALPVIGDTITVGTVTITFVDTVPVAGEVQVALEVAATIGNVLTAFASHPDVDFSAAGSTTIIAKNKLVGQHDDVLCSTTSASLAWDYTMLIGLEQPTEQVLEWPRDGAISRVGVPFLGIPEKLRQATVEYALRAVTSPLMPDPVTGETGQDVRRIMEKVGPIETETAYSATVRQVFKKYPEADKLIHELLGSIGGVHR